MMIEKGSTDDVRGRVRQIIHAGEHVPEGVRGDILGLGLAAVPALVEILQNQELSRATAPERGRAPVHRPDDASGAQVAQQPRCMLHALSGTDEMDLLRDQLVQSVLAIGASVIESAPRGYAESDDPTFRDSACAILAEVRG